MPVGVSISVPGHGDPVVVERTLGQGVDVLVGEVAWGGVGVEALLVVHDTVHRVLPARLSHRAPAAGPACPVTRDHRPAFHSSRCHRLGGHAVVVHRWLRLRVLDAVQRPRLLFLPFSLHCGRETERKSRHRFGYRRRAHQFAPGPTDRSPCQVQTVGLETPLGRVNCKQRVVTSTLVVPIVSRTIEPDDASVDSSISSPVSGRFANGPQSITPD